MTLSKNSDNIELILSRLTYNEVTGCYQLNKEDYLTIKHSITKRKLLNKIIKELGIKIEIPYASLPELKCIELFDEYNTLRNVIENCNDSEIKTTLEEKRIKLRNIIVENNIELITAIIERRLNSNYNLDGITDDLEEEDIYQIGYEVFINYVDNHNLYPSELKNNLTGRIMLRIRAISAREAGFLTETITDLNKIKELLSNVGGYITPEEISKRLGMEEVKIKDLLNLDSVLNPENISSKECSELTYEDRTIEDIYTDLINKHLLKLIDTLNSEKQKQTLYLVFGLNGFESHKIREIGEILGVHRNSAYELKNETLKKLSHPLRIKYLAKILNIDISKYTSYDISKDISRVTNPELRTLEKFLFSFISQEEILELTASMKLKYQRALLTYLGYEDILEGEKIKLTYEYISNRERGLTILRNRLTEKYVVNSKIEYVDDYFDYLMYNYLIRSKKK